MSKKKGRAQFGYLAGWTGADRGPEEAEKKGLRSAVWGPTLQWQQGLTDWREQQQ